jgi:DNA helicase-2/ATP-dependent DNA helicase PcrA
MPLPASVEQRLAQLAADQRAAATAPRGPVLCIAPAGSGKTTTLVARVAWLVATGTPPATICAVTFNRRAADELAERVAAALAPLGHAPDAVRVRTFHALGREILLDAGYPVEPLVDRLALLRELEGDLPAAAVRRLDDGFSRLKLDLAVDTAALAREATAAQTRGEPPGPVVQAFLRYEATLADRHALDFDDLVRRALDALERAPHLLERWRQRCAELLVDEVQDVDRSQLRLALLLAAPANRVFLVGDDDQTIYAWRLADVRRVLDLAASLPGLQRVDLVTNYRCPPAVTERAVRLVERNGERFAKTIRPGPSTKGHLFLLPDPGDDVARARRLLREWPAPPGEARAVLARTNAELAPYAAAALELGIPYRANDDGLVLDDPVLDEVLAAVADPRAAGADARAADQGPTDPRATGADARAADQGPAALLERLLLARSAVDPDHRRATTALLAWAPGHPSATALARAVADARVRRAALRRDDAPLLLATVHATKGLEFDHVAVVGLDEGRFPSTRSVAESDCPARTLEEERRLAYVAWTRARRSLTLVYDPDAPSPFLQETFSAAELRPR